MEMERQRDAGTDTEAFKAALGDGQCCQGKTKGCCHFSSQEKQSQIELFLLIPGLRG